MVYFSGSHGHKHDIIPADPIPPVIRFTVSMHDVKDRIPPRRTSKHWVVLCVSTRCEALAPFQAEAVVENCAIYCPKRGIALPESY